MTDDRAEPGRAQPDGAGGPGADEWYDRVRLVLGVGGGREPWAQDEVARARRAAEEAGLPPAQVHGPADAYARERLGDREPEEVVVATRGEALGTVRSVLGPAVAFGIIATTVRLWQDGWTTTPDLRAAVFVVGFTSLLLGGAAPVALRLSGRPRAERGAWAALVVGAVVLVLVTTNLPRTQLRPVPTLLPLAVLVVVALGVHALAARRLAAAPGGDWFTSLDGLLRGRHDLPGDTSREIVDRSREHWALARLDHPEGSGPEAEFGDLEVYAASLAQGRAVRTPFWRRGVRWLQVGVAVVLVLALARSVTDGSPGWEVALRAVLAVVVVLGTAVDLSNRRAARA